MASRVAVVDYGMGNLRSVAKALECVGASVTTATDPHAIRTADRVVFPGVGAIRDCLAALEGQGLREAVIKAAREKPFLGICLGMQALMETSWEYGRHHALGLVAGRVVPFAEEVRQDPMGNRLKVPHMGWNRVSPQDPSHPLWVGIEAGDYFYFVHSYFVDSTATETEAATTWFGLPFTSALSQENLFAVQFHPEKSSRRGLRLLANFLAWDPV